MSLSVWTKFSGWSFGVYPERVTTNIPLPVNNDAGVEYSIIAGKLPPGLRIVDNYIVGTPFEVSRSTEFTFCIRAQRNNEIADRTYKISIEGADPPEFITPEGDLPLGSNQQYFVLDSTYVDFQIEAIDFDTSTGQRLSFFISENDGELPPGLILTTDGRIVGFVQPVLSIKPEDGNGFYDTGAYDAVAYDFGYRSTNGYDSYIYDEVVYDFSIASRGPLKLNRNYEFYISVTDGDTVAKRKFKIFVVGDDYFRADNNVLLDGTGLFTADVTYLRAPIWITPKNLGTYRANNYLTFVLDIYDPKNVVFINESVNSEVFATAKQVLVTDNVIGSNSLTIYNIDPTTVPVTNYYISFNGLLVGATDKLFRVTDVTALSTPNSYRLTLDSALEATIPNDLTFLIGTLSTLPPGMSVDITNAEVFGRVPYQPAITKTYNFTITAKRLSDRDESARSSRTFTVQIIGEIDSVITWYTDSNLGTINANFVSTMSINATSTATNANVLYTVIDGKLPTGLSLDLSGEIIGKVNQYGETVRYRGLWFPNREYVLNDVVKYNNQYYKRISVYSANEAVFNPARWIEFQFTKSGLTTITDQIGTVTFDEQLTSIDRVYTFSVQARDQYGYSASIKEFTLTVVTPNTLTYSNIKVKPFLKLNQREIWKDFINDSSIFNPSSIYRPNDPNFGLQTELSMIVYGGIETTDAAKYISAMGLNHKKKRFHFGSVKKGTAVLLGTTTAVYEVIYVEMIDPIESNGKYINGKIRNNGIQSDQISADNNLSFWTAGFEKSNPLTIDQLLTLDELGMPYPDSPRPSITVTTDNTGYLASDPNQTTYYPNSITNWRSRIKTVGETERNYLPLWMRSIQPGDNKELGFTLCIPICYCKVGTGDNIILNIKFSNFDFKVLDYTVDRYIIDAVKGSTEDKYLIFRNDRITI